MFSAILALLVLPIVDLARSRGMQFKPSNKSVFFAFVAMFLVLMQLGAKHVESPYIEFGQLSTGVYFIYFVAIVLLVNLLDNSFILVNKNIYRYFTVAFMPFTSLESSALDNEGYVIASIALVIILISVLSVILYKRIKNNSNHALGANFDVDTDDEQDGRGQQDGDGKPIQNPVPGRRCPNCLEKGDTV
jgi:hypothetical protein